MDSQEAVMCHRVRVLLSTEEKEDVKKLTGIMVPVYATIMLVLVAVVAVTMQQKELTASNVTPITAR
jgi:hypothetical protein